MYIRASVGRTAVGQTAQRADGAVVKKYEKGGGFLENVISLHKKVAVSEVNPVGRDAFGRRKTTGRPDAGRCAGRSDYSVDFP